MHAGFVATTFLLAMAFLFTGAMKLFNLGNPKKRWSSLGLPTWLRYATGVVEILGVLSFLTGLVQPIVGLSAVFVLTLLLLGALGTHLRARDTLSWYLPAALLLLLMCLYLVLVSPMVNLAISPLG